MLYLATMKFLVVTLIISTTTLLVVSNATDLSPNSEAMSVAQVRQLRAASRSLGGMGFHDEHHHDYDDGNYTNHHRGGDNGGGKPNTNKHRSSFLLRQFSPHSVFGVF
jgi:hypothetical protein